MYILKFFNIRTKSSDCIENYNRLKTRKDLILFFLFKYIKLGIPILFFFFVLAVISYGLVNTYVIHHDFSKYYGMFSTHSTNSNSSNNIKGFFGDLWKNLIIYPLQDLFWLLPDVIGWLAVAMDLLFHAISGITLVNIILNSFHDPKSAFSTKLIVIISISIGIFTLLLMWRGFKILRANADEGRVMLKETPGIIFWCITSILLIPIVLLSCEALMIKIIQAATNDDGSEKNNIILNLFLSCFSSGDKNAVNFFIDKKITEILDPNTFAGHTIISYDDFHKDKGSFTFNPFLCLVAFASMSIFSLLFSYYSMLLVLNILFCYILIFPAIAKWPQDEGFAATEIRNEMIRCFLHMIILVFFYNLLPILFSISSSIIDAITANAVPDSTTGSSTLQPLFRCFFQILWIIAVGWSGWKASNRVPTIFAGKHSPNTDNSYSTNFNNEVPANLFSPTVASSISQINSGTKSAYNFGKKAYGAGMAAYGKRQLRLHSNSMLSAEIADKRKNGGKLNNNVLAASGLNKFKANAVKRFVYAQEVKDLKPSSTDLQGTKNRRK